MGRQIEWSERAVKDLERLDPPTRERIILTVERFAETNHGDVKRLQGGAVEWRLRVGSWRVRFVIDDKRQSIGIVRVLPRSRAYRD